ncbi:hypothetical protein PFISCL1PPCAC_19371, partial [Pristionchus fissidentatus]
RLVFLMSYLPLSPPHSNRLLACLCSAKLKKVLFYLGLKILIFGLIFHRSSGHAKKPITYRFVDETTQLFQSASNQSCQLPNANLFPVETFDLSKCDFDATDWLWVNVNGDVLPKEGRENAYCKKRKSKNDNWEKLKLGERIDDIIEVRCKEGPHQWQNFLWKLRAKEGVKREVRPGQTSTLTFEFSSIGQAEFRQKFRSTIIWLKNNREYDDSKQIVVHAKSNQYFVDKMFGDNEGNRLKDSHATLIIDREGRNLSSHAEHYGAFRYEKEGSCMSSDEQHLKSLSVVGDFISVYGDSPLSAFVHLTLTKSSDYKKIDHDLALWLEQNKRQIERTTIIITAGRNSQNLATHKDLLDMRLPFLAIMEVSKERKIERMLSRKDDGLNRLKNQHSLPCSEAGVGEQNCMCVQRRDALASPTDVEQVIDIANALITWINEQTLKYRFICQTLALDEVIQASKLAISPTALRLPIRGKSDQYFIEEAFTSYKIRFTTKPGKKVYETTIVYFSTERVIEIDKESFRLISDEEQHDCMRTNPSVINFCSCKERRLLGIPLRFFG